MDLVDLDGYWPSWNDIKDGTGDIINSAGDWIEDHQEEIIEVAITTAVVVAEVGITVATGGAAAGALVAVSAGAGAISGGVMSAMTGGDVVAGACGGAINGTVSGIGSLIGAPGIGNFAGGAAGSVVTDVCSGQYDVGKIATHAIIAGGVQNIMTVGGKLSATPYDANVSALSPEGLFLGYVTTAIGVGTGAGAYGITAAIECEN